MGRLRGWAVVLVRNSRYSREGSGVADVIMTGSCQGTLASWLLVRRMPRTKEMLTVECMMKDEMALLGCCILVEI